MGDADFVSVWTVANAGTPMLWLGCGFLVFGNLVLGIIEGWALAWLLSSRGRAGGVVTLGRAMVVMVLANYVSAWLGYFAGDWLLAQVWEAISPAGPTVHQGVKAMVLLATLLGVMTIVVECGFAAGLARWCRARVGPVVGWCAAVQVMSVGTLAAVVWMVTPHSLVTELRHDPTLAFVDEAMARQGKVGADVPRAWVYFIARDGRSVRRVPLTERASHHDPLGEAVRQLGAGQLVDPAWASWSVDRPLLRLAWRLDARDMQKDVVDLWLARDRNGLREAAKLIEGVGIGGCMLEDMTMDSPDNQPGSTPFDEPGGVWPLDLKVQAHVAARLLKAPSHDDDLHLSGDHWVSRPVRVLRKSKNPSADADLTAGDNGKFELLYELGWAWSIGTWGITRAQHIGDLVVVQVGFDQVCVIDLRTRTIGLLAHGCEPVVVFKER